MGVASVALVYDLVRRRFGRAAGFVAGLVLATTPITVAISRHNNPDALLILCSRRGAVVRRARARGRPHALADPVRACASGSASRRRWPRRCSSCPAIAAAYLWVAPRGRGQAIGQLLAGGAAMTVGRHGVAAAVPPDARGGPPVGRPARATTASSASSSATTASAASTARPAARRRSAAARAGRAAAEGRGQRLRRRHRPVPPARREPRRPGRAGCSASRSSAASRSSSRAGCGAPTPAPAG